jgi:hypothetical protein
VVCQRMQGCLKNVKGESRADQMYLELADQYAARGKAILDSV